MRPCSQDSHSTLSTEVRPNLLLSSYLKEGEEARYIARNITLTKFVRAQPDRHICLCALCNPSKTSTHANITVLTDGPTIEKLSPVTR